ncbi:MAG: hypothetical protein IJ886_09430 [Prevotella sp.]|nr:hypothetical protein [Prevotella sp.]
MVVRNQRPCWGTRLVFMPLRSYRVLLKVDVIGCLTALEEYMGYGAANEVLPAN